MLYVIVEASEIAILLVLERLHHAPMEVMISLWPNDQVFFDDRRLIQE